MNFQFKSLSDEAKGIIYILFGILILLYAFNFFQRWLNIIVIVGSFVLILYGLHKVGGIERIQRIFNRKKQ